MTPDDTSRTASRSLTSALKSVPSESLIDGSGERLGDMRAAPGERRPRVDAEASEDAGERLGLEEGARDLFVSAGAGRRMRVNDRPRRGALRLELSAEQPQRPFWPGKPSCGRLHCSSAATARASRDGSSAAPLAEKDLELAHAPMVADASP